jgi:hypothetical protein
MTEGSISHAIYKSGQQPCVDGPWDETAKSPVIGAGKHRETNTDLSNSNNRASSSNLFQIHINKKFY